MQQNKFYSGTNSGAAGTVCTGISNLGKLKETAKRIAILHYVLCLIINNTPAAGGKKKKK